MKALFAILALALAPIVQAETYFTMPNQNGGQIQLENVHAPDEIVNVYPLCEGRYIAKAWGQGTEDTWGCWTFLPETATIVIHWLLPSGTQNRTYSVGAFTSTAAFEAKYGAGK